MTKIAILYSTVDGHTLQICERLQEILNSKRSEIDLMTVEDFNPSTINTYQIIVIGASIRYGKHRPNVQKLLIDYRKELGQVNCALFSVNLVARKEEKNTPHTNPYMVKFLKKIGWEPPLMAVFAGKLDYKRYTWFDSLMIKLIMVITKGPTHSEEPIEFTDWKKVKAFGEKIKRWL